VGLPSSANARRAPRGSVRESGCAPSLRSQGRDEEISVEIDTGELESREPPRVVGRYLVGDQLASGGMARVHIGRLLGPAGFSRTVAIKCLLPHLSADPEFVGRLVDEARIASRVRHANVVQTLDIVTSGRDLILVLDYVHGESLSRLRRLAKNAGESGRVPPAIAAAVVASALRGLHAAHEATNPHGEPLQCIHRDVSPQNILVGADGVVRVLDFGIAKAAGRIQETRQRDVKGKLAYMSPEQLARQPLDRRCDLFAAGIVLWEALSGDHLFHSRDPIRTMHAICHGGAPPLAERVAGVTPEIDAVIARALAKNPDARFATADGMARAIEMAIAPASDREVAEWVERIAGDVLARRMRQIGDFESANEPSSPPGIDALLRASDEGEAPADTTRDPAPESGGPATADPPTPKLPPRTAALMQTGKRLRSDPQAEGTPSRGASRKPESGRGLPSPSRHTPVPERRDALVPPPPPRPEAQDVDADEVIAAAMATVDGARSPERILTPLVMVSPSVEQEIVEVTRIGPLQSPLPSPSPFGAPMPAGGHVMQGTFPMHAPLAHGYSPREVERAPTPMAPMAPIEEPQVGPSGSYIPAPVTRSAAPTTATRRPPPPSKGRVFRLALLCALTPILFAVAFVGSRPYHHGWRVAAARQGAPAEAAPTAAPQVTPAPTPPVAHAAAPSEPASPTSPPAQAGHAGPHAAPPPAAPASPSTSTPAGHGRRVGPRPRRPRGTPVQVPVPSAREHD